MMHDISTISQLSGLYGQPQHGSFSPPQLYGQQSPQLYGQQLYGQPSYGQSPLGGPIPGLVPIVTLVPQALLLSLAMQSLQQTQGLGAQPSQFGFAGPHGIPSGGMPQFGIPFGQPQPQFGAPFGQPQQFGTPFGQPQFGAPFGQPQFGGALGQSPWGSPWQSIVGQFAGGRGLLGHQQAPWMSYAG